MQARIEPRFLLNTLAQVKRLYNERLTTGEQLLDALIAHLHAVVPRLRDTSSTVGHELELIRTYLAIARLRMDERLAFTVEVSDSQLASARIPAMLLLPLIEHAISLGFAEWHASGSIVVEATATRNAIQLRILVSGSDVVWRDGDTEITNLRERLATLYAGKARVTLSQPGTGQTEAVLEIPRRPVLGLQNVESDLRGLMA